MEQEVAAQNMPETDLNRQRKVREKAIIQDDDNRFIVSLNWKGESRVWLLTGYEKRRGDTHSIERDTDLPEGSSPSAPPQANSSSFNNPDQANAEVERKRTERSSSRLSGIWDGSFSPSPLTQGRDTTTVGQKQSSATTKPNPPRNFKMNEAARS